MAILQASDFSSGEYKIAQDLYTDFSGYIDKYEKEYLINLLGVTLYGLFVADLTGTPEVPQNPPYTTIFNEIKEDIGNCVLRSEGIKAMLIKFVYFHITRDLKAVKTTTGVVGMENENSVPTMDYNLITSFNSAVDDYLAIQEYIRRNPTDFPDYNGQFLYYMSGI